MIVFKWIYIKTCLENNKQKLRIDKIEKEHGKSMSRIKNNNEDLTRNDMELAIMDSKFSFRLLVQLNGDNEV